jgi:hypothetical protein
MTPASKSAAFALDLEQTRRALHKKLAARPGHRVAEVEGFHGASVQRGKATPIDAWVADLLKKPEKKRAESLYELLLRLNLSLSHLENTHETYARRLGLR